jgi:adenylate kinase
MIVIACGLSDSGKTTAIEAANVEQLGIRHVIASKILRSLGRRTRELTVPQIVENQRILVRELLKELEESSKPLLLDGHLMIETGNGPSLVPLDLLDALPLVGIVLVEAAPQIILARRKTGDRSADDIAALIAIEASQARKLSARRKIRCVVVESADQNALISAVRGFTTQGSAQAAR